MNREQMQREVDRGHAEWVDENTIQYNRSITTDNKLVMGPGAIIRLIPDEKEQK